MAADSSAVEQAVSRTLRDNLGKIQRTAEELHQAVSDMIAACASNRPSNALPSMLRAQTSAAALSATLEVLSHFVTSAMQPAMRLPVEPDALRVPSLGVAEPVIADQHLVEPAIEPNIEPNVDAVVADRVVDDGVDHAVSDVVTYPEQLGSGPAHLIGERPWTAPAPAEESPAVSEIDSAAETISDVQPPFEMPPASDSIRNSAGDFSPGVEPVFLSEPVPVFVHEIAPATESEQEPPETEPAFSLDSLSPAEQELHRRAFRVAKVSMQDIKMLRPEDVRLGRENKDLCFRLRDDIEKAHKEYDRRFQTIQSHPVDYFYDWMVEILAGGDSEALGEYPYPSPVLHR